MKTISPIGDQLTNLLFSAITAAGMSITFVLGCGMIMDNTRSNQSNIEHASPYKSMLHDIDRVITMR